MLSSASVKAHACEVGFDACGVAPAAGFPELAFLRDWLSRGYAGRMGYLPRTADRRLDVRRVLPSARSVIVTATLYNTPRPYSVESTDTGEALVSRYGWGDDYHGVLERRLDALLAWMRGRHDAPFEARPYVDTGPIQERVYAQYAGLGWIGKNTCLVSPDFGSWVFLAEIVCSLDLEPDGPGFDRCGTCTRCLDSCPTGALIAPRVLDATRCLSYLTIELKGPLPESHRDAIGRHVFGCDICQEVCPWNPPAVTTSDRTWLPRPGLDRPRLADLWRRSDSELRRLVEGTPLTRPGLAGLRRNLATAVGNSGDRRSLEALADEAGRNPGDDSIGDPMVQEHVSWSLRRGGTAGRTRTRGVTDGGFGESL